MRKPFKKTKEKEKVKSKRPADRPAKVEVSKGKPC